MGPLLFTPYLRQLVWGGRRLGERLGKNLPGPGAYGESWEVSDHPSHVSVVAAGPLAGRTLRELMESRRQDLMGAYADRFSTFPWLVKLLDANDWLSVQVHPDDEQARRLWPGEGGKSETWFVLDAEPGSRIYAGLLPGVDERALRGALARGNVAECLHSFTPTAGDSIYLPAGTVHALGGGILLVEVQQTSDATFRLFDWNRRDDKGKSRQLHIEEALACIDWKRGPVQPLHTWRSTEPLSSQRQLLASCEYFHLELRTHRESTQLGGADGPELFIVVAGGGVLETDYGTNDLRPGQAWLIPAGHKAWRVSPKLEIVGLTCKPGAI